MALPKYLTPFYQAHLDHVRAWTESACDRDPALAVPTGDIYAAYAAWATQRRLYVLTHHMFTKFLLHLGYTIHRSRNARLIVGLALRATAERSVDRDAAPTAPTAPAEYL